MIPEFIVTRIISLLIADGIIAIAATLAITTGFGFVVFCAPLLSFLYDPTIVVVNTLLMGTILIGILLERPEIRHAADSRLALELTIWSVIGLPIGLWLLLVIDRSWFRGIIGFICVLYSVTSLSGWKIHLTQSKFIIMITGVLAGIFGSSVGLSSLPVIWLLGNNGYSTNRFKATIAIFVFLNGIVTLISYLLSGVLKFQSIQEVILFLPALLIGVLIGRYLERFLTEDRLRKGTLIYLGIIGFITIVFFKN
jgi:uncharacterized protein